MAPQGASRAGDVALEAASRLSGCYQDTVRHLAVRPTRTHGGRFPFASVTGRAWPARSPSWATDQHSGGTWSLGAWVGVAQGSCGGWGNKGGGDAAEEPVMSVSTMEGFFCCQELRSPERHTATVRNLVPRKEGVGKKHLDLFFHPLTSLSL